MPECYHVNSKNIIKNIVDNAIIPYPYPVAVAAFKFFIPMRSGIAGQAIDRFFNTRVIGVIDFFQGFNGLWFDRNLVRHLLFFAFGFNEFKGFVDGHRSFFGSLCLIVQANIFQFLEFFHDFLILLDGQYHGKFFSFIIGDVLRCVHSISNLIINGHRPAGPWRHAETYR